MLNYPLWIQFCASIFRSKEWEFWNHFFYLVSIQFHWINNQFSLTHRHTQILIIANTKMEKAMAPHSSTLAWKIPWTEEPGRLQSMVSLRVGHDEANSLWLFTFMHWRRKWQPTAVFLPGESQGRQSLVGCCLWGCTELETTEATEQSREECKSTAVD